MLALLATFAERIPYGLLTVAFRVSRDTGSEPLKSFSVYKVDTKMLGLIRDQAEVAT